MEGLEEGLDLMDYCCFDYYYFDYYYYYLIRYSANVDLLIVVDIVDIVESFHEFFVEFDVELMFVVKINLMLINLHYFRFVVD